MRFEILIQFIVPLTFLAIWALTSILNRDAQPLPPRPGRPPGPAGVRPPGRVGGQVEPLNPGGGIPGRAAVPPLLGNVRRPGQPRFPSRFRVPRRAPGQGWATWTRPSSTSRTTRPRERPTARRITQRARHLRLPTLTPSPAATRRPGAARCRRSGRSRQR